MVGVLGGVFVVCPLCCGMLKLAVSEYIHCKVCACVHDKCV